MYRCRDEHVDARQYHGLHQDRPRRVDEGREHRDVEYGGLWIEQISNEAPPKIGAIGVALDDVRGQCFGRVPPTVPCKPQKIDDAAPAKQLIKKATPTTIRPSATPTVAAKPDRRPRVALSMARYAMFGPGVSSMTKLVRAKAPSVSSEMVVITDASTNWRLLRRRVS
jgi:hypothetical protein